MIQVTNLTKVFRGETDVTALTGINLNVDDGDIYGIIGMSGAGKSTLLRCIALLETPTQGRIEGGHLHPAGKGPDRPAQERGRDLPGL